MRRFSLATWVFLGLVALGIASLFSHGEKPTPAPAAEVAQKPVQRTEAELMDGAIGACEFFVQHSLNDPDSAQFDRSSTFAVKKVKGIYHVTLGLRAKNAFNALIWGQYDCEVIPAGDSWMPLKIKQRP